MIPAINAPLPAMMGWDYDPIRCANVCARGVTVARRDGMGL